MNIDQMKQALIKDYRHSLDSRSRWFTYDLASFTAAIGQDTEEEIKRKFSNMQARNSVAFKQYIDKEERRMLNAGMFNIGNMKPTNALD